MYFSFLVSTFFVRYAENLLLFDGRVEDTVADLLKKMTEKCVKLDLLSNKIVLGYIHQGFVRMSKEIKFFIC